MQFPINTPVMTGWATIPDEEWLNSIEPKILLADVYVKSINMALVDSDEVKIQFRSMTVRMHFIISKEKLQSLATRRILGLPTEFTTEVITNDIFK